MTAYLDGSGLRVLPVFVPGAKHRRAPGKGSTTGRRKSKRHCSCDPLCLYTSFHRGLRHDAARYDTLELEQGKSAPLPQRGGTSHECIKQSLVETRLASRCALYSVPLQDYFSLQVHAIRWRGKRLCPVSALVSLTRTFHSPKASTSASYRSRKIQNT